jgi:hypothetical protein
MTPINRQAKREQWKAFIEEQEKSGFSQAAFCKQHNLSTAQFGYYRRLLNALSGKAIKTPATFMPVKINQQTSTTEIHIALPNGFQCHFPCDLNKAQIKDLVEVLLSC